MPQLCREKSYLFVMRLVATPFFGGEQLESQFPSNLPLIAALASRVCIKKIKYAIAPPVMTAISACIYFQR